MRLIPFGAFQVMLGILFAVTVVLALLATAPEESFQGSSTMLAILLLGLQRGQKLSRGGQILSEKEEGEE